MQSRPNLLKLSLMAAAVAHATTSAPGSWAAEATWNLDPTVEIQTGHDSNLRLARDAEDSVLESSAGVSLVATRSTETSDVALTGGYTLIDYSNAGPNIADRDQQYAQGVLRKRWTRWAMGIAGGVRRDDLLRTIDGSRFAGGNELGGGADQAVFPDEPPLDDLVDDGTDNPGFDTEEQVRRVFWRGNTYGQYELTERDRLRLGYGYAKRNYSAGALDAGIRDSERHTVDAQYARDLTERSVILVSLSASQLETDGPANDVANNINSDFYQGLISWRARFDERTRLEFGAGFSYIDAEDDNDTGFLLRARGTTRLANGLLTAELRRALVPNAFGNVAENDLFMVRYARALSERLSLDLIASGQFRERGAEDQRIDRDHIRAGIGATWTLTPQWSLSSEYNYSWIDRSGGSLANPGTTDGHRIMLGVAWTPRTISLGQ